MFNLKKVKEWNKDLGLYRAYQRHPDSEFLIIETWNISWVSSVGNGESHLWGLYSIPTLKIQEQKDFMGITKYYFSTSDWFKLAGERNKLNKTDKELLIGFGYNLVE